MVNTSSVEVSDCIVLDPRLLIPVAHMTMKGSYKGDTRDSSKTSMVEVPVIPRCHFQL